MVTDQVVHSLRDRVRHSPAPTSAVPGRLDTAAWVLLHRAVPFDPAVQTEIAHGWGRSPAPSRARRS